MRGFSLASEHSTVPNLNYIYLTLTTDAGDLSSAFDMVDHDILISQDLHDVHEHEHDVGLKGTVFIWFRSLLKDHKFSQFWLI